MTEARRSDIVDITADLRHETEAAWLVFDGARQAWLPKSMVELEIVRGSLCEIALPEWLAREKALI